MRNLFLISIFGLFSTLSSVAQSQPARLAAASTAPNSARYEIIQQANTGWPWTMRLDRYTGRVFQLEKCPQKTYVGTGSCWKEMIVIGLPPNTPDGVPRYQIFASGEQERFVFLMNVATGQTWQIGAEVVNQWAPLLDTITLPQSFEIIK